MRKQQHVDAVAKASRQTISALMQDLFNNIEHTRNQTAGRPAQRMQTGRLRMG